MTAARDFDVQKLARCRCGSRGFELRFDRLNEVALVTCDRGHASFLFDSGDYWFHVIQERRPRALRCKCSSTLFEVWLGYWKRDDGDVETIQVTGVCRRCEAAVAGLSFQIDYSPTDGLIRKPLEACADPWLKPKWIELSALWKPADVIDALGIAVEEGARLYTAPYRGRCRPVGLATAASYVRAQLAKELSARLLIAARKLTFGGDVDDAWKSLPVIEIDGPTRINYSSAVRGELYFLSMAETIVSKGKLRSQEGELLELSHRLLSRLRERFVSARGSKTIDNPAEAARVMKTLRQ